MHSVLCFGDSNTYGVIPGQPPGARYAWNDRWPGVLQHALMSDWQVIEEGLPGRTTISDDPVEGAHLNGRRYLRPCLESHKPLDAVIIMLGTNDLKARFQKTVSEIAIGFAALVQDIREDASRSSTGVPFIVLVSPPEIRPDLRGLESVFEGGYEKSQQLADQIEAVATNLGVGYVNGGKHAVCSELDGFHIDSEGAAGIGAALAKFLRAQFPDVLRGANENVFPAS